MPIAFDNSYARLPDHFFARVAPTPGRAPRLIRLNRPLAEALGLDPAELTEALLAGNSVPTGAEPIALAYAGHQFGNFVPQLGDGRAVLLGELVDPTGRRFDLQLKGAGRTPFSRMGDGRAALGPVLREYVVSEAMAALGIPTTRALAATLTGEGVMRETILPGAVLARVAASHIRVGTFQFFAARGDEAALRALADHAIQRHYPEAAGAERPALALLDAVITAQATLVARWLCVGFIHGVMNTDNMSIAGETIDYGPCAFLDAYDPAKHFSAIDQFGRYAFGNQPRIAQWNLTRLAEALLPLIDTDQTRAIALAEATLAGFPTRFEAAYHEGLRRKLGLATARPEDIDLISALFAAMAANQVDYTAFFRALGSGDGAGARALFIDPTAFDGWAEGWRARLALEDGAGRAERMRTANPMIIPRNHRIEALIRAAVEEEDFGPFEAMLAATADPYADRPEFAAYAAPPALEERVHQTFCGT
ncbi:protein adenylyltransferase SelO [Sphingomonas morindae]|uniref:Protein nucleotidyltransferase YdiU n=1 Tax=Sphingomonas morindae TaxID=1541170 RepID=A0ABY4X668_9SPHN|nr:YdiU family protein [Sphingomonas morindae]USI72387.1 YdiU family protein [Sphingomonas morindae]